MSTADFRSAALALASRGWPVFPLGARKKTPITSNGVKDSTSVPAAVAGYWSRFPTANIGLACGPDSVEVLDVDGPEGEASLEALVDEHKSLPETMEVRTGRGRQLYFLPAGVRNTAGKLGPGIDTRGDGGYVVAPPSVHPNGAVYTLVRDIPPVPWPSWLLQRLGIGSAPSSAAAPAALTKVSPPGSTAYGRGALRSAAARVAEAPEGTRNFTLNREAHAVAQLVSGGEVDGPDARAVLEEAARDAGLPDAETRRTLDSALIAGGLSPRSAPPPKVRPLRSVEPAPPPVVEWIDAPPPTPRPTLPPEALHGLAGRIVRALAPHTEADPLGLLAGILTMFGVVVGRGPHVRVGGDRHGTNLFVRLVGPTSEGRKGTAVSEARRVFRLAGDNCIPPNASGLSSGEGFVYAIRDEVRALQPVRERGRVIDHEEVLVDAGVADKRLLVLESELGSVLRRMEREGNTLSALMRQAWDGTDLCTLTKKPIRATDPHVGLIAQVTPAELAALMSETESLNGWANRILFLSVLRPHLLPHGGSLRDHDLLPLALELRDAAAFGRELGEVERTPDARMTWERAYPLLTADRPGLFGGITARGAQHVVRLSLLYALLDRSGAVAPVHLHAALSLWRASEESARGLFGGSLGDTVADDLLAELDERPEGMTRNEMMETFRRNVPSGRIGQALSLLARLGLARGQRETPARTPGRRGGGRPVERWRARAYLDEINEVHERTPDDSDRVSSSNSFTSSGSESSAHVGGEP